MSKYIGSKRSPSTSVNKLRFVRERGFLHKLNRIRGPQCQFMHINKGPDLVWQRLKMEIRACSRIYMYIFHLTISVDKSSRFLSVCIDFRCIEAPP